MKEIYRQIEEAIYEAGKILMDAHLMRDEVFQKEGPANFVTIYDKKIQSFLISRFKVILPQAAYFGEEETEGNVCEDVNKGYVFFIDPIDGTTNFLFDYNHSCVSVGLALDGKMIAGFVYIPYNDRMYKAVRGEGAFLNGRRLEIEDRTLAEGVAEFGCARYNDDRVELMMAVVKELFLRSICIRNGGSSAIGIAKISSSSNVLYFELMLQPYDYAAASVILEEAGGRICQCDGSPITFNKGCPILAGSKRAVAETLEIIASC